MTDVPTAPSSPRTPDDVRQAAASASGWTDGQIRQYLTDVADAWDLSKTPWSEIEDEVADLLRRARTAEQQVAQAHAELAALRATATDEALILSEARSEAAHIVASATEQTEERLDRLTAKEVVLRRTAADLARSIRDQRAAAVEALTAARAALMSDMVTR